MSALMRKRGAWRDAHVALGIIGPGRVGSALIRQLKHTAGRPHRGQTIGLYGIASRTMMRLSTQDLLSVSCEGGEPSKLSRLVPHLLSVSKGKAILIDCTASDEVADGYADWLDVGIHVATPNKHAGSGPLERWTGIQRARAHALHCYETTVGAGLPVLTTLRDLIDTGDSLISIDGMLSGTIAWLLNRFDGTEPFSSLVREAHGKGLTEPNPAEDLSGMDVARKLVILAREAGIPLSLSDVDVSPLSLSMPVTALDADEYFEYLKTHDAEMEARLCSARKRGMVLRYVASLDSDGRASVGLQEVPTHHAFAQTGLTDNIVRFRTRRYDSNSLYVRGPGAGADVTAAGVYADILRIIRELGD